MPKTVDEIIKEYSEAISSNVEKGIIDYAWKNESDKTDKTLSVKSEMPKNVDDILKKYVELFNLDSEKKIIPSTDYAWKNKFYDDLLVLLKTDYQFPEDFNMNQLSDNIEDEKNLKIFVKERMLFHSHIQNGNLKEIQVLVSKYRSKFYLNVTNTSASYCAIKNKKFEIYAYLTSVGVKFLNSVEESILDNLSSKDRAALTDANVIYSPSIFDKNHIYYLMAKSRSPKIVQGASAIIESVYSKLDEDSEISIILKVIQHSDRLDIIFDFDEDHVAKIYLMSSKRTKGETMYKERRLYIAASHRRG